MTRRTKPGKEMQAPGTRRCQKRLSRVPFLPLPPFPFHLAAFATDSPVDVAENRGSDRDATLTLPFEQRNARFFPFRSRVIDILSLCS